VAAPHNDPTGLLGRPRSCIRARGVDGPETSAPRRTIGGVPLCCMQTIAQVGRGSSLTRQTGWPESANPHNSHTSDPPNAPEGASEL
jgi:hypothetical protein